MQIVIDIDTVDYEYIKNGSIIPIKIDNHIYNAIRNGTPLKGHGRLGDLGKIYVELNEAQIEGTEEYKGLGKAKQIVCDAKTIIEADEAESEVEECGNDVPSSLRKGKWLEGHHYYPHFCSNCNYYTNDWDEMNFCPKCGSDMRESEDKG